MRTLTDGERDILAEQQADARDCGEPFDGDEPADLSAAPPLPAVEPDPEPDAEFPW